MDALNGMPGVLSARWAGGHGDDQANLELVLAQLADVPDERRGAAFVCAAALVYPAARRRGGGTGEWRGRLIRAPRGSGGSATTRSSCRTGDQTSAELTAGEKDALRHRGRAFRALAPLIAAAAGDD